MISFLVLLAIVVCFSAILALALNFQWGLGGMVNFGLAGFYTLGLVEGMAGHGDIDGDGIIYLHELDLYATTRVRQLSFGTQNPTFSRPASVRPFPIAKPEKKPAAERDRRHALGLPPKTEAEETNCRSTCR